ncbi:MAG TPA: phosphoribosylformylglycinamidine synthase subunit PurS [Bacteroidota bacterium]|nr:phosphoribosylformylglycinamidine synthase subunit PurS [Bacteroidota bacterium]
MFRASINITLRSSILDPQGKAVHHALGNLGLHAVEEVRIGKLIELRINCRTEQEAKTIAEEACRKLLANPVMEDFTCTIAREAEGA